MSWNSLSVATSVEPTQTDGEVTSSPATPNVTNYFYCFEFQDRGTVHLPLLIWVKEVEEIRAHLLNATIPRKIPEEAFLVSDLQKLPGGKCISSLENRELERIKYS